MSDTGNLIPISDEQAKAVQEALKTLQGVGGYLREILGTVPEDVVALLGGNLLKVKRAENLIRTLAKAHEKLKRDGIKAEPASLSLGLPILIAAADESREELQDLWAKLLAAAADPARATSFRLAFIETVKLMDPLDASVLSRAQAINKIVDGGVRNQIAQELKASQDQIEISIENLITLRLMAFVHQPQATVTPFGREFLRAIVSR
jgi:hypothetical protein